MKDRLNTAQKFQESLSQTLRDYEDDKDQYLGLIRNLQDCADPELNHYERNLAMSNYEDYKDVALILVVLSFMGLPLQIFGKGSLFGPYTPLQQLDLLADYGTKSYLVGSTNSLLLQQKDRYCDILINLDEGNITISSTSLRAALALSVADRRWIDFLTQAVNDTWDEANPSRPKTLGYVGSEEFIRLQFEEYLLSMISSVKYRIYSEVHRDDPKSLLPNIDGDPSSDFGVDWVSAWMKTDNFKIFHNYTDSHLFDIVEPRHPCAGGLTIEDVQRRLALQVSELHLDERFNTGKEALGKHLATGQKKVSSAFNNLWADIEAMREAQRQRQEEQRAAGSASPLGTPRSEKAKPHRGPHLAEAQAHVAAASSRAGAYLSSWAVWAGEKRKTGWSRSATILPSTSQNEGNQRISSDENSEATRRKSLRRSTFDPSTGARPVSSEYASREDSKQERTPLGKIEPSSEPLPRSTRSTDLRTVDKAPGVEEPTNNHNTQETPPGESHKASVKA
ncbi:MAG: late secretory pathway protein avl9 [Geoglossum umbratile]|nr:MAG: late secretory pathway protein avl9 [Geoglossum umbratile]